MPMRVLDEKILENFQLECLQDLKMDVAGDFREDRNLQGRLLAIFYAYYRYFQADYTRVDELRAGLKFCGSKTGFLAYGAFRTRDEEAISSDAPPCIEILVPVAGDPKQKASSIREEIEEKYAACKKLLMGLRKSYVKPTAFAQHLLDLGLKLHPKWPVSIIFLVGVDPTQKQAQLIVDGVNSRTEEVFDGSQWPLTRKILFAEDIDYLVTNTATAIPYVPSGKLELDRANNVCGYDGIDGEGGAAACTAVNVNVLASSLQRLWRATSYRGLLAQNLRYYVKMARVDRAMADTMRDHPERFWYFNNGLTIICKSFKITKASLRMTEFSIVNGGQTTHNIGMATPIEPRSRHDFALPCRVIAMSDRSGHALEEDARIDFMAEISTATNSQKPIKASDTVANRREILTIRKALKEDPACAIYLQRKRGEPVDTRKFSQPWQIVKTEQYGQLLLAFLYQAPCAARNKTKSLFEDKKLYEQLFTATDKVPPLPATFVRDLLRLQLSIKAYKRDWAENRSRGSQNDSGIAQRAALVANGELLLVACVGLLCKVFVNSTLQRSLKMVDVTSSSQLLGVCDVAYPFLKGENVTEIPQQGSPLFALLDLCLNEFIYKGYIDYCQTTGTMGDFSNFAKSDIRYLRYVQRAFVEACNNGLCTKAKACLEAAIRKPSAEERDQTIAIQDAHPIVWGVSQTEFLDDLVERTCSKLRDEKSRSSIKKPGKKVVKKILSEYRKDKLAMLNAGLTERQFTTYGKTLAEAACEAEEGERGMVTILDGVPEEEELDD